MAVVGVINLALIAPMFVASPLPAIGAGRLEVVTFNTQLLDPIPQLDWVLANNPDIAILFESSRQAESQLAEGTDYVVNSGIAPGREFGVTVLTREPVSVERLLDNDTIGIAVRFETEIGGRVVAVYGVHPASPTSQERATSRNQDLSLVGQRIADETISVVVAGDLNATPWSHGFSLLAGPADLATTQLGTGLGATWPAHVLAPLRIPLDHILHTRDLTSTEREVGPVVESDHRPVRAVIGVAETSP
jgi:endonuclease/exonuclease/phosphatase (EEP) superfamily protein YafD